MTISVSLHNITKASARDLHGASWVELEGASASERVKLFCPPHIAAAAAAAFNQPQREPAPAVAALAAKLAELAAFYEYPHDMTLERQIEAQDLWSEIAGLGQNEVIDLTAAIDRGPYVLPPYASEAAE